MKDVAHWIEHYRRFWEQSLDRLESYLKELQTTATPAARNPRPARRAAPASTTTRTRTTTRRTRSTKRGDAR